MTTDQILFNLFIAFGVVNMAHIGFYVVGANIYDISKVIKDKKYPAQKKEKGKESTLVTVLIPAHNEEKAIIRCLESVRKSSHKRLQILVIDDASKDDTRKLVNRYIKEHPGSDIHLLRKQKNVGKAGALTHTENAYLRWLLLVPLALSCGGR